MGDATGFRGYNRAKCYPLPCKCLKFYNLPDNREYDPAPFWLSTYYPTQPDEPWFWLSQQRWLEVYSSGLLCKWRWDPLTIGPTHQVTIELFEVDENPDPEHPDFFGVRIQVRGVQYALVNEWFKSALTYTNFFYRGTRLRIEALSEWEPMGPYPPQIQPPQGTWEFYPHNCQPEWYPGKPASGPPL